MNFLDRYGTESGCTHDLLEPGFQVSQGGDVLKALVGERSAVVTLGRGDPAKNPTETVVVVVLGKTGQGLLGGGQAGEALAVEDLGLEDVPEGLDLAVGPGRRDLRSQMPDMKLLKAFAETREQARQPADEWLAVVAHELQGLAAEFEAFIHPEHDGSRLFLGQDAQADDKSRVVVDQTRDPGLDVSAAEIDEEGAFQIDVPQLVGSAPLIARARRPRHRAAAAAACLEELINVVGADAVDLAPAHLCGNPFRIPVGVQTDGDDDQVDPGRDRDPQPMRASGAVDQADDPLALEGGKPAVERATRDLELAAGRLDSNLMAKADSSHPEANLVEFRPCRLTARPTVLSRQEQEPRTFLITMPAKTTVRIGGVGLSRVGHA